MKITKISTELLDIPLKRPHKMAFGTVGAVSYVLVRLQTDEGVTGLGEANHLGGPLWSAETVESIKATIDLYIAPILIGRDATQVESIMETVRVAVCDNFFAKAAVEMALWDAVGKYRGVPVYDLLGGLHHDSIPLSWSLASGDAEQELEEAQAMLARGVEIFKFKVAAADPAQDVQRVRCIRAAMGDRVKLRVDANQGWNRSSAIGAIRQMEEYRLDFAEQPVPRWDLHGMSAVARAVGVPLMADESLATPQDAINLIRADAAGVFGIKLTKAGGLLAAKRLAAIAEGAGIPCYVGCMIETSLGTAAYLHFACSTPQVKLGCELFGPLLIDGDICTESTRYEGGKVLAPRGPGLGVDLDEAAVARFRR